jgi:site-specific recombinase XerD
MENEDKVRNQIDRILNNPSMKEHHRIVLKEYYDTLRLGKKTNFSKRLEQEGYKRRRPKAKSYKSFQTYLYVLADFADFLEKPFNEANEKDIDAYRASLKERKKKNDKFLSNTTYNFYSLVVKMFYLWHLRAEEIPKMVDYEIEKPKQKVLKPEDVLLSSDIKKMIKVCSN